MCDKLPDPITSGSIPSIIAQSNHPVPFSIEFYPPRNHNEELILWKSVVNIAEMGALFASVTYGAGGSTAQHSVNTARIISQYSSLPVVSHITTILQTSTHLQEIIAQLQSSGIENILALRGDLPEGVTEAALEISDPIPHALDLIKILKKKDNVTIGVAAFPNVLGRHTDRVTDARLLIAKFAAGATFAITQMFFRLEEYFELLDLIAKLAPEFSQIPIIPGIMPITSTKMLNKLHSLTGEPLPKEMSAALAKAAQEDELLEKPSNVRKVGIAYASEMCRELLLQKVPCLHFCTLNYTKSVRDILTNLGLSLPPNDGKTLVKIPEYERQFS